MSNEIFLIRWGYWSKAKADAGAPGYVTFLHDNPGVTGLNGSWKWVFADPARVLCRLDWMERFKTVEQAEEALIGGILSTACPASTRIISLSDAKSEYIPVRR